MTLIILPPVRVLSSANLHSTQQTLAKGEDVKLRYRTLELVGWVRAVAKSKQADVRKVVGQEIKGPLDQSS
jgi:hypothetical protein